MRFSYEMPSRSSVCATCCIVSQSDWLPMMMPIVQLASLILFLCAMEGALGRMPASTCPSSAGASSDDVRQQFAFDLRDLVFQHQLALFQPLQLQLVERGALGDTRDHVVEIAVLGSQSGELRLQGFDVNLMLFALWRGALHGQRLHASEMRAAEAAIAPLRHEIVAPLRALRRRLNAEGDADIQVLRRRILGLELAAERTVQSRLAAIVASPESDADRRAAEANLVLYLGAEAQSAE